MRIIGLNFKKISAERKKDIKGKLEIKSNLQITKIEKENIDIAGDVLRFSYIYEIKYEPDFAEVIFKGNLLLVPNKPGEIKKIIKEWKKQKLDEEIKILVFNFIMSKCNLKALQLEEEFTLPPHIPLPKISKQQNTQQANYTG